MVSQEDADDTLLSVVLPFTGVLLPPPPPPQAVRQTTIVVTTKKTSMATLISTSVHKIWIVKGSYAEFSNGD